jgi:glucose-1-phosphate thymidylyltransferase
LAQAFIIGREFIAGTPSELILGDNIYYGHDFKPQLREATLKNEGSTVFAYHVNDPERYGIVEFDKARCAISIEEKPLAPNTTVGD